VEDKSMVQITIEYMIMIPILIMQIFLFPLTAGWIMNTWTDSRQTLALQETASHLGSSIQQVYSALNHDSISAGAFTNKLDTPPFIEGHVYKGTAALRNASDPNSARILDLTLTLVGTSLVATSSVTLGQNVLWQNSTLMSNSTYAGISAEKLWNGTIQLSFTS
jgi:hypothetical protein